MRVALINPRLFKNVYHFFPTGLGYIAAALERQGIEYSFIDQRLENWNHDQLVDYLKREPAYECFGISGLISSFRYVEETCRALRKAFPITPIVLGGKISKVNPEILFDNIQPTFIIDGEGEEAFVMVLDMLSGGSIAPQDIPGLIYRDDKGRIHCNEERKIKDVNLYHIPYERLPMDQYISRDGIQSNGLRSLNMISSRGCPFQCTFCNFSDGVSGKPMRLYDVSKLEQEITYLKNNFDLEHIFFNDDVFALSTKRLSEMGSLLYRLGIQYTISMRLDALDEEKIKILEETGCKVVMVGVESASPKILKIIDKRLGLECYQTNIELCQKSNLIVSFNFITGYLGETEQTLHETYQFLLKNRILYTTSFATAYPGTKLYEMVRDRISDETEYVMKLSDVDLQTDYLLNMTKLSEKRLMEIHSQMVVDSALNSLTQNKILQVILRPFFQCYWGLIKLNSSHIWWLRRATDLINWVIIKPIFRHVRRCQGAHKMDANSRVLSI